MTPSQDDMPHPAPRYADSESSGDWHKRASSPAPSTISSIASLPYRRSNPTLSSIFSSTSNFRPSTPNSGTTTPTAPIVAGSVFSPPPRSGAGTPPIPSPAVSADETRTLILRSFVPHVAVLASPDTDETIRRKGFPGGLLELLRPYGERVQGRVTIRDSAGGNRSWDDYGVRFVGLKDGLGVRPWTGTPRHSSESKRDSNGDRASVRNATAPFVRVGGDIGQIEDAVDRHLLYSEVQFGGAVTDYFSSKGASTDFAGSASPFYKLYLRRLLSGLPMTPHETFAHPVACVVAVSARSPNAIPELRQLYDSTDMGDQRLPQWVSNDYLRYYILVHDEDHDEIGETTRLYEQMKRHFGLHCHLLRIRSTQCVSSDDDAIRLPLCDWLSASEELAEIQRRETSEDLEDPTPCLFESDATAIRTMVRELVTQSIIPHMERSVSTWNEQVASRRRGISGRFMSLSKKWTPFASSRNSIMALQGGPSSNYDSLQGFYRPDTPEAIMRKLADYSFMLRDFKFASINYELIRADFNNDKAWKYYAGANEMTALSTLMNPQSLSSKTRSEGVDQMLETACYSYNTRCASPYNALRTLAIGLELLRLRGSSAADDAARWASRVLEDRLVGSIGGALFTERVSACYIARRGIGSMNWGTRRRKAAMWAVMAADAWLRLEKTVQAEKCLDEANELYGYASEKPRAVEFDGMDRFITNLRKAIVEIRLNALGGDATAEEAEEPQEEPVEEVAETLDTKSHRMSLIGAGAAPFADNVLTALRSRDDDETLAKDDRFE
ncbi:hypothetical protein K490DRAFT_52040 [Saccharata proteae CBS 121410]|uniref:TRAPP complex protein TRS85 n=1 Tax=Saccharata proteae CBS 121410 TaxID=1314787 RepID=A0A9P4LR84_9PEZI|nr:hypothetical protein K490DRAFT_52040 [Saccharata proteae CBS 121410]